MKEERGTKRRAKLAFYMGGIVVADCTERTNVEEERGMGAERKENCEHVYVTWPSFNKRPRRASMIMT